MLEHFFPLLFPKDSESLKILDIQLWEVGAERLLNGTSKVTHGHTDTQTDRHFDLLKALAQRADALKIVPFFRSHSPPRDNFFMVRHIFHKILILMVYSQLVFINEGSADVVVIFVQDFYLFNLSKNHWWNWPTNMNAIIFFGQVHQVSWTSSKSESPKQRSWGPLLTLNRYTQADCIMWHTYI